MFVTFALSPGHLGSVCLHEAAESPHPGHEQPEQVVRLAGEVEPGEGEGEVEGDQVELDGEAVTLVPVTVDVAHNVLILEHSSFLHGDGYIYYLYPSHVQLGQASVTCA